MTVELSLHTVTWNVMDLGPPDMPFSELLGLSDAQKLPDLIVIGLQEAGAIGDWSEVFKQTVVSHQYVLVQSNQLQGMLVCLYCQAEHVAFIRRVDVRDTKCSFGGFWGNKGAVSIRAEIYGVTVIFINSHLSAFDEKYAERIAQFDRIIEKQEFQYDDCKNILDHDYIFWLGDLNFRINNFTREEVLSHIENNNLMELLRQDQLTLAIGDQLIFLEFEEGRINFPPTYKFDPNTDVYDSSEKQRKPAWCDRILWLVHKEAYSALQKLAIPPVLMSSALYVNQHKYNSLSTYKSSDHKPVVSLFSLRAFTVRTDVEFQPFDVPWYTNRDNGAQYIMAPGVVCTKWDWIGLYQEGFHSVKDDFVSWVRPKPKIGDDVQTVFFPKWRMRVKAGWYRLLYVNDKEEVLGISVVFQVEEPPSVFWAQSEPAPVEYSSPSGTSSPSSPSSSDNDVDNLEFDVGMTRRHHQKPSLHHLPKSPINPAALEKLSMHREVSMEEDIQSSLVKEDMSLDQLKKIQPQLYGEKRYSDPSILRMKASSLSARLTVTSSDHQANKSVQNVSPATKPPDRVEEPLEAPGGRTHLESAVPAQHQRNTQTRISSAVVPDSAAAIQISESRNKVVKKKSKHTEL